MKVYFSPEYVLATHAFDTTRKAGWIADSLRLEPIPGVELVAPEPLTAEQLIEVHSPEYVAAVRDGEPRALAQSQGFGWDAGLWTMVRATNGGAVAAALTALKEGVAGSLSSGLHHARRDRGGGFCTFNGLVLAARAALTAGAKGVLMLDLDAHCGGGTASLIRAESRIAQYDVSVSPVDAYDGDDMIHVDLVRDAGKYLATVELHLRKASAALRGRGFTPELILYNAGMDPYAGCDIGGLDGITVEMLAERERLVFEFGRQHSLPLAFVLAGGYIGRELDQAKLVALHRLTVEAAAVQAGYPKCVTAEHGRGTS